MTTTDKILAISGGLFIAFCLALSAVKAWVVWG